MPETHGNDDHTVFDLHATVKAWDSDYYHPIAERYYDRAIELMLRLMSVGPGADVLDAGCGPGVHSIRVARAGFRVRAIDISQTMLREAKARAAAAGLSTAVEFQEEDLTRLTLPDASFKYVFSWGVIIHIHDVEKALDELARIVAPGGRLALYVTNRKAWDHKIESLARLLLRKRVRRESFSLGNGVWYDMHGEKLWVWQFDIPELQLQLERRGFRVTDRVIGEFSELQRRVAGPLRRVLLHLNNICFRLNAPASAGVTNMLIFQKN